MSTLYDVAVIGAGPGGYVAAIRAAQHGLKVACIDDYASPQGEPSPGGTCLNVGCIPSKALLQSSELYHALQHEGAAHGISVSGAKLDVAAMLARKNAIVTRLTQGIRLLFERNSIAFFHGRATPQRSQDGVWQLSLSQPTAPQTLQARHVILAMGSRPRALPGVVVDNVSILDNAGALALKSCPARLGVIGAGVIGLELGSVWQRLGAQVTLLEMADVFLPALEKRLSGEVRKALTAGGMAMEFGVALQRVEKRGKALVLHWQQGGEDHQTTVDKLIVAVGREPNSGELDTEALGLTKDARGGIAVDELCRTGQPGLWAIGDLVRGPMLAHKAMHEGIQVADAIAGQPVVPIDLSAIPAVIYTDPEVAWVGITQLADGIKKGSAPFGANGRALALGRDSGRCTLYVREDTDRLVGAAIIGPQASELINEITMAMTFQASAEDLSLTMHAHPTLSEVLHEAALAADKRAIHG
ncbi:dihydrolipoamide dehydrogenase [Gibbsiella quercinecans]|uniref:Dihydrolipoyl dehydrogenase n=1 Tax=Gibbsiella quercinecans TaxID=929813 RepID=A0A250B521_9GAMM|nr:dihydrolipoyl dehydrogenase [Gibbsiella quercinecans]ATA21274.1 dihydrolipoamide dehydrogenase [Gibbsiella quercinecans]RLM07390.1 dihydrolipoyl dehydrogenase [Gibbsiella quercinecans]RLM13445.1 dihydrolipoyl dehydrogenase [Gibbsiella quercinecans]TCT88506.1 dihydrolipoamide dehydrogenase [Gibbsiella quercinecans]